MVNQPEAMTAVRLDKWLWAARFFKTRPLAAEAIAGGKVHIDGADAKPGRSIRIGTVLTIRRGVERFMVRVIGLAEQRGPASVAITLYEEYAESRQMREEQRENRRLGLVAQPLSGGRPTKKARRQWEGQQRSDS